jgi:tetratricopeptide (TPR) repeat protein
MAVRPPIDSNLQAGSIAVLAITLFLALAVGAQPSRAQQSAARQSQASQPSAADSRIDDLSSQAAALYKKGKYAEAGTLLELALKLAEETYGYADIHVVPVLNSLSAVDMSIEHWDDAVRLLERVLRIGKASFGPDDPVLASTLTNLALALVKAGRLADAEPVQRQLLMIEEKDKGAENPDIAPDISSLGEIYMGEKKFADAEPIFERLLRIEKKALGPNDPDLATIYDVLANIAVELGHFDRAESQAQTAIHLIEKAHGPNDPSLALSLGVLTEVYDSQKRYTDEIAALKRIVAIDEKALGPESTDFADELNKLGNLEERQGDNPEAEQVLRRALAIREKALGPAHPDVATDLSSIAQICDYQGRFDEAEPLHLRALRIREKALGTENPDFARALGMLALHYDYMGRYADAVPLLERALRIEEKALGPDHPDVATTLGNLASVYAGEGKYSEAESLLRRALGIDEKAHGTDHADVATDLNNLAMILNNLDRYAEAESLYQRALAIREKTFGPESTYVATSLDNLAAIYVTLHKLDQAEPLYQRALKIDEKLLGPAHINVATDLNNLAELYEIEGRAADAEPLLQRALDIREKALGSDHPEVATALVNFAVFYDGEGRPAPASPLYRRALDNLYDQFQYNFTYMTEAERLTYLETVAVDFPGFFSFVHRYREQDPALVGDMYNLLLWEKGMIAGSIEEMRRKVGASGDREALQLLAELTAKRTQLAGLLNSNPPNRDLWRKQVAELGAEANSIEKALVVRSSAFAAAKQLDRATWQQVRDALAPGEAAVEFARFRYFDKKWTAQTYYVALIVTAATRDEPAYIFLGGDKQIENDALASFDSALQTRGFAQQPQSAVLPGARAYELIWKPLEPVLNGVTRIDLAPDGRLNTIPIGIIPAPDGKLLMERYDLRLVSSTKDLLRHGTVGRGAPASVKSTTTAPAELAPLETRSKTALLIGNPLFDLNTRVQLAVEHALRSTFANSTLAVSTPPDSTRALANTSTSEQSQAAPLAFSSSRSRDMIVGQRLPPLPGTGAEIAAIAELMQAAGWKTELYTEQTALKSVVQRAASPRVLHLATHGFFLPDQQIAEQQTGQRLGVAASGLVADPHAGGNAGFSASLNTSSAFSTAGFEDPMLRSGLYFAGANRTLAGEASPQSSTSSAGNGVAGAENDAVSGVADARSNTKGTGTEQIVDNGILTALEAGNLDLTGTDLVVLSACNTGQGKVENGEGVFGLRRALEEAGAQSVMMSLWSVPDKETLELMKLFYQKWLGGTDKHEALKQAQLEMRQRVRGEHDGHDLPYYWAAFVLVGK